MHFVKCAIAGNHARDTKARMQAAAPALSIEDKLCPWFTVLRTLGKGAFGLVLEAMDRRTGGRVAIKMESQDAECPQLQYESRVMAELQRCTGFPKLLSFESSNGVHVLVMEKLGKSLEFHRLKHGGVLPMDVLAPIATQCLERLQTMHTCGFAYRDVKPDNFLLTGKMVFLIDFGLCKRVCHPETGVHIHQEANKHAVGTPRYMSKTAHQHLTQSRRDDLESLAYVFVYLAKGSLPWQLSHGTKFEDIGACKEATDPAVLCAGLPQCFLKTLNHAFSLGFTDIPDYRHLFALWST